MRRAALFLASLTMAACTINQPPPPGGNGQGPGGCTTFADTLVAFTDASGAANPEAGMRAIGAPDSTAVNVVPGAVLTIGFVGLGGVVDNGDGDDILLHTTMATTDALAAAYVEVDDEFLYIGDVTADATAIDLAEARAEITTVIYIELVGMRGTFAVDAIEAVDSTCDM